MAFGAAQAPVLQAPHDDSSDGESSSEDEGWGAVTTTRRDLVEQNEELRLRVRHAESVLRAGASARAYQILMILKSHLK